MKHFVKLVYIAAGAAALAAASVAPAYAELTPRGQSIIPIAAFTANGNEDALKGALSAGLEKGLTINEIRSILEQMYAYTGFPRSLTGLGVLVKLLHERESLGIHDPIGREATPLPADIDIHQVGTQTQTSLVGHPVTGAVYDLSPNIDTYLKEHLFGDIFANDILTWRERELATVAALAALPAPAQLRSHLNVCLNVGISPDEINDFASVIAQQVGAAEGKLAQQTVAAVLQAHK